MKFPCHFAAWLWIGAFLSFASATQADDSIRTYSVPKEHPQEGLAGAPTPASDIPLPDFKSPPIQWTVPPDWKTLAPTSIRIGNFVVGDASKTAEIAVESFPGSVGAEVDNVNRWRQQVGLSAISQAEIIWKPITVDGGEGKLYDLSGASQRTLVAAVPHDDNFWFFKMRGDKDLVSDEQSVFLDFLKTVKFNPAEAQTQSTLAGGSGASSSPSPGLSEPPEPRAGLGNSDPHAGLGLTATGGSSETPKWNVPSNWAEKTPGPMVSKSFSVTGNQGSTATVSISVFPGEVGGVLANVNRWRGQLGLPPVDSADLPNVTQSVEASGGKAVLVDLTGSDKAGQPARLIAAIVPHGGSTWFYKMLGGPAAGAEKENFVKFVQTAQYP